MTYKCPACSLPFQLLITLMEHMKRQHPGWKPGKG